MVFTIQRLLPGDPALIMAGEERDPEVIAYIRQQYRLDEPLPVQYAAWLGQVLKGDLGHSYRTRLPVTRLLLDKLPVTVELTVLSLLTAMLIGIPAGIIAAVRKGGIADYVASIVAVSGLSLPNFWLGIMMILLVSVRWKLLPASGYVPLSEGVWENLQRMIMPALVLGTALAGVLTRQTRSALRDVLKQDYIRTAEAQGRSRNRVTMRHALRNARIPIITIVGLQRGALLSGAVLTEQVFTIPGFGKLVVDAVFNRDHAVVQGIVLVTATAYIVINLLVDVGYALANPKIQVRRSEERRVGKEGSGQVR